MPPLLAQIRVRDVEGKVVRLRVPLFMIWLLALSFLVPLLPVIFVVLLAMDIEPLEGLGAMASVIWALRGAHIEMESPRACILIHVI